MYSPADLPSSDARRAREEADLVDHRRDLLRHGQLVRLAGVLATRSSTSSSARYSIASAILSSACWRSRGVVSRQLLERARGGLERGVDVGLARQRRGGEHLAGARDRRGRSSRPLGRRHGSPLMKLADLGDSSALLECGSGWRAGGTSSAGLRSKNPTGFSQNETASTGITGQSSRPRDVVDAEDVPEHDVRVLDRAVLRGPRPAARGRCSLWTTNSPHGQRSSGSIRRDPQRVARSPRARRSTGESRVEHAREARARHELVADRRAEPVGDGAR